MMDFIQRRQGILSADLEFCTTYDSLLQVDGKGLKW